MSNNFDKYGLFYNDDSYDCDIVSDDLSISNSVASYLNEIGKYPLLSSEEEISLALAYKNGDKDAKAKFINSNLRLVVYRAKRFSSNIDSFLDIIQEGNIGLIDAVERFDPSRGIKFSTYAVWWIDQKILMYLNTKCKTIKYPVAFMRKVEKYKKIKIELTQKLLRIPTFEELSEELGISIDELLIFESISKELLSLNDPIGEDEEVERGDFIPSNEDLLLNVENDLLMENIVAIARREISDREIFVIFARNGFYGDCVTLDDIGFCLGVTRERIRQMEIHGMYKIKNALSLQILLEKNSKNAYLYKCKYSKKHYKNNAINTIYSLFPNYSKEEINLVIEKLSSKDKNIIRLKYGNDLLNPVESNLFDDSMALYFYKYIICYIYVYLKKYDNKKIKTLERID